MRVTTKMIDKDLRGPGFWNSLLLQPQPWSFQLMAFATNLVRGGDIEGLANSEAWIPRPDGSAIRARIFGPQTKHENLPALLYLHGGGYAFGAPEAFLPTIADFIRTRPSIVIAPAYRRSLEAPYPAAIDDCYSALLWVARNAAALGVRRDQIMVAGHSAGGGLTAALSFRARDRGEVNIAFQMPLYPMLDDR